MDRSAGMYEILEYSLTRLTSYNKSRHLARQKTDVGNIIPIWEDLEPWLVAMGWKGEALVDFKTLFVQQFLDRVGSHVEETYDPIKSAIGSALE